MLKKEEKIDTTEQTVTGFRKGTKKAKELDKKQFFKMLAAAEDGLTLSVEKVSKIFISKFDSDKVGCFIDYSFTKDSKKYEIGIYYNLGEPTILDYDSEGNPIYEANPTEDMNIFKILAVATDLSEVEDVYVTEEAIQNTLTGITFKAEIGTSFNGTFLIEPIQLVS